MTPIKPGTAQRLGLYLPQHHPERLYPRRWVLSPDLTATDLNLFTAAANSTFGHVFRPSR